MNVMELVHEKHFPLWGLAGSLVGLVFVLTPQLFYSGTEGEPFSMFNHAVSELGELGVSELAWMFNIGLFVAGILFIPFMIGLGIYIDNIISKIAAVGGVYSAVSVALVGVYPMNYLYEHSVTAISFFLSGMVMTLLWAIAILAQREVRVNKALSLGGFINMIIFALFLYGPFDSFGPPRPEFSMRITLEWAIYFAIIGYLLLLSLYVWRKERNGESPSVDSTSLQE
ncbi:MAG: DUF998 domain-containing protein [Candidatus Thorarchaeota archaeon]|jgi:hypothetical membrane protein